VGPHLRAHPAAVDRAARRAPRQAHVQRAALGAQARVGRRDQRVTLYGLPIATRTVAYGAIDPALSRELFIRRALVERDWDTRHHFFADNGRLLEEVEALERRARRRDILADDATLVAFFEERIPAEVVSGAHFDRWWRDERRRRPDLLTFTRELLVRGEVDERGRPDAWRQGDLELPLS